MDVKAYIESGVLELYALGLLDEQERSDVELMFLTYPQVRFEYEQVQNDLEDFAFSHRVQPPEFLGNQVVDSISNLQKEKEISLENLPVINRYSSHYNWLKLVDRISDIELINGRYTKVLRHDEKITQLLVVSETDIVEETHDNELESFLILSGTCKCTISGKVQLMGPGDFMEIPLHEVHDVAVITKPVMAILQLVKLGG